MYTSGGTVYLYIPSVNPQLVPHIVSSTNTDYHLKMSSANLNQDCSSDRPLSARELAELILQNRKDHLPEWKLARMVQSP